MEQLVVCPEKSNDPSSSIICDDLWLTDPLCTSHEKIYSMELELITLMEHSFVHSLQPLRQLNNSQFLSYWCYNPLWFCILQPSSGAIASSRARFLDHKKQRATVGRTPLDEWPVRRRDLYLTTHSTHNRQISMPPGGIRTHDRSRRAAVDRAATGTGLMVIYIAKLQVYGV